MTGFFPADEIIIHLFFFRIEIGSIDRYITGECGIFRGQQKAIALIGKKKGQFSGTAVGYISCTAAQLQAAVFTGAHSVDHFLLRPVQIQPCSVSGAGACFYPTAFLTAFGKKQFLSRVIYRMDPVALSTRRQSSSVVSSTPLPTSLYIQAFFRSVHCNKSVGAFLNLLPFDKRYTDDGASHRAQPEYAIPALDIKTVRLLL